MEIRKNYSLKKLNTFGIDARANLFADIKSTDQLRLLLEDDTYRELPKLIIGGGSNILMTDDFAGLVIKISIPGIEIIEEEAGSVLVKAGAGELWHDLVLFSVGKNLGGIENLSLIPGTVGAAPMQNIGAYGQEIGDTFERLDGFYVKDAREGSFSKEECKFGYRDSVFKNELKTKFIITSVVLRLSKNPDLKLGYGNLKNEVDKLGKENLSVADISGVICRIREGKLPDPARIGNAGSFFKNPEIAAGEFEKLRGEFPGIVGYPLENGNVKLAAGWLIENCGWKGKRVGNTGTHESQALVIVNYGGASGREIISLAEEIKNSVFGKFSVKLEEEINII